MNYYIRFRPTLLILTLVLGLANCSSDTPAPKLKTIKIESSNGTLLDLGETATVSATGLDQSGKEYDIASSLQWSADNSNVSVDQTGLVTGLAVGKSLVTAEAEGVKAVLEFTVWDSSAPRLEVYVSDAGNFDSPPWQILKFDGNGQNPTVFANTNLGWPQDILFLEDQEVVLVSNLNNGNIVKFDINTGMYEGTFATGIGAPTRMKIGPDGLLYVLQWQGNGKVKRYQLTGTYVDDFTSVGVTESIGLDWDDAGNLYVSSFNGGTGGFVRKFDTSGNDLGKFIETGLTGPTNIWFDESGNLIVNDWSGGAIRKFGSDGAFISNLATGLAQVEGIDFLDNGDMVIGNGGTAAVKQFTTSGTFVKDFIPANSGGLIKPNAVVLRRVNY